MIDSARATPDQDALLDAFAAELTHAAYQVALRHGAAGKWLELQLDLWHVVAGIIKQRGLAPKIRDSTNDFDQVETMASGAVITDDSKWQRNK